MERERKEAGMIPKGIGAQIVLCWGPAMPMALPWFAFRSSTGSLHCQIPDLQTQGCFSVSGVVWCLHTPQDTNCLLFDLKHTLYSRNSRSRVWNAWENSNRALAGLKNLVKVIRETTLPLVLLKNIAARCPLFAARLGWGARGESHHTLVIQAETGMGLRVAAGTRVNKNTWRKTARTQSKRNIHDAFSKPFLNLIWKDTDASGLGERLQRTALRTTPCRQVHKARRKGFRWRSLMGKD